MLIEEDSKTTKLTNYSNNGYFNVYGGNCLKCYLAQPLEKADKTHMLPRIRFFKSVELNRFQITNRLVFRVAI